MSTGYIIAAEPDLEAARALAAGFGLDVLDWAGGDPLPELAGAENIGIVLSAAAAADEAYVALLQQIAQALRFAQLIAATPDARAAFPFFPEAWPTMLLDEARARAEAAARSRGEPPPVAPEPPLPPKQEAEPRVGNGLTDDASAPGEARADEPQPPPEPDFISSVFIASATGDAESRLQLKHALKERGISAIDADDVPLGAQVSQWTLSAIAQSWRTIVLWSARSTENEWLNQAIEIALSQQNLILALLDNSPQPAATVNVEVIDLKSLATRQDNIFDLADYLATGGIAFMIPPQETRRESLTTPEPPTGLSDPKPAPVDSRGESSGDEGLEREQETAPPPATAPESSDGEAPLPPPVVAPAPATTTPAPTQTHSGDGARLDPPEPPRRRQRASDQPSGSAPADATAFAPKKFRRGTPELVRIVIHQPQDLADVIKAARKIDPRTAPAPQGMSIGEVALGASVGVSLEVRGAACDGTLQRRTWAGVPIDFSFSVEPDADVKQAVILARVFVDDAQIGVIAFTRSVTGATKPQPVGDKARMKRHKRVFLSYSSKDRETVSAIATAYQMAGVQHFWDRASLKSGEEWHPRLRREIDRADLFHLCWSKSAAASEWVEKEAEYALTRRRRSNGKKPDITVQMLDGPPWAPHPPHLDSINFDDFVRAAIVGYARGDGES
jgi:hypothetical protein